MKPEIKVFIYETPWRMSKSIFIVKSELGKKYSLINNEWVEIKEGLDSPQPTLSLEDDLFQQMIDALSETVKPTVQAETDAELKATKYHLEDMRTLVFNSKPKGKHRCTAMKWNPSVSI